MLKKLSLIFPILPKLGYSNVAYMLWYRLSLKWGWRKPMFPKAEPINGGFFNAVTPINDYPAQWKELALEKANAILESRLTWFHYHQFKVGNPPNWFLNPFDYSILNNPQKHWTDLSDFDLNTGDIKIIWEPSRFDWVIDLARAYRITGQQEYLDTLNHWLIDWSQHNPLNTGPNWKCGQEASIRLMKLISATQLLEQDLTASEPLKQMLYEHLGRIRNNITYAWAQDNNHGTSEAAALYIGAVFLLKQTQTNALKKQLYKYRNKGKQILLNRINKLLTPQGVFSQRSVTYHRVVVDTMSWVLYNMQRYNEPAFTDSIRAKLQNLGELQYKMISSSQGETPNLGSNDGAMLLNLHHADYRDFRPSTQLFFAALKQEKRFAPGLHDEPLFWFYSELMDEKTTVLKNEKGILNVDDELIILQDADIKIFFRLPHDRFRFATCDALHLDIWYKGKNILGDSGSYSYNAGEKSQDFESVSAHNTVQFGEEEQMPKISRFLYGAWLKAKAINFSDVGEEIWTCEASYTDYRKNTHKRMVHWESSLKRLTVIDQLDSPSQERKKLFWQVFDESIIEKMEVKTEHGDVLKSDSVKAFHSLYYLQKTDHLRLTYETTSQQFKTIIQF